MDSAAARALAAVHQLHARSGGLGSNSTGRPPVFKIVGLVLAIASGLFIGVSFVLKKYGLLKANVKYNEEAGEGYGYLKNVWWWSGMTLMIIGEVANFAAYAFTDALLVTPLGALSVVVTTILSAIFLKERLSFVGKVGCFNCIIGSVVIVINAPEQSAVADIQDMKRLVISPGFLSYAGVIIVACTVVALWLGPKYGKRTMMVYLSICSLIGGLSVVATQGLGAAIVAQIGGKSQFKEWFTYVLLAFVISTLLTEIIYLNKALNLFNAALVTPTYYVFFTSATIVTSAILFRGFKGTPATISTIIMGFLQICAGVVLLQLSKSAKDVPDTAVFKGDLDQVRTVAEQEEPEYEPRADTIRGGGAILRSLSKARTEKQAMEAKRLHEEQMQPIGENEQVEWDGLRRRRTVFDPSHPMRSATMGSQKPVHPPLGMSHFPSADDSDDDTSYHPGFFQRLRSRIKSSATRPPTAVTSVGMSTLPLASHDGAADGRPFTVHGDSPPGTPSTPHQTSIQFAHVPSPRSSDSRRPRSSMRPPQPPPHTAKRQFSFQNVFSRHRAEHVDDSGAVKSSASRSRKSSRQDHATEEETLGLVKGDSENALAGNANPGDDVDLSASRYMVRGSTRDIIPHTTSPDPSSEHLFHRDSAEYDLRRTITEDSATDGTSTDKEYEKGDGGARRAFL